MTIPFVSETDPIEFLVPCKTETAEETIVRLTARLKQLEDGPMYNGNVIREMDLAARLSAAEKEVGRLRKLGLALLERWKDVADEAAAGLGSPEVEQEEYERRKKEWESV